MAQPSREEAMAALADSYASMQSVVDALAEQDFLRPTRCAGWSVADLIFHQLLDAQRALRTLATPAPDGSAPDVNFVTYWKPFTPGSEGSREHAQFVRVSTVAYEAYAGHQALTQHWAGTSAAALRAAAAAPDLAVCTQGHVLTLPDFLATLAVEATLHHLDLVVELPAAPAPSARGLRLVRNTLDGLLGGPIATDWDDVTYALKGGGRLALTDNDRLALGSQADNLPLLG